MQSGGKATAVRKHRDLLLLLSLLVVILLHPVLDHGIRRRLLLGAFTFVPLVLAALEMAQRRGLVWPYAPLMTGAVLCGVAGALWASPALVALQWTLTTATFAVAVGGLFAYLRQHRAITTGHLYTAASIYLLLGMAWFSLYHAIETVHPGSFLQTTPGSAHSASDLLYFSLATLTTLGYGDIVPALGVVRMLAVLEAAAGVLYVAITVALLVSGYQRKSEE